LVDLAIKEGLQGLSITDHDTVDAYAQIQSPALRLLPGCEFSTVWQEGAVHVLAYGFNPRDPRVLELCVDQQRRRVDRNRAILERLRNYRMEIREEEMALQTSAWGRPHIAQALVQKGYVGSVREAFQRYLGEGKLCYVPGSRPSTAEMIEWLKQLSAIVVLAHPHLLPSRPWVHELLALPWDGIEAHYAGQSEVACKRFVKMAEKRGWLVTGGSDYHGSVKPQSRLGTSWTDEKVFDHLYNHYQAVSRQ
jgi:predicted metal-dependent phosphoesterase TrpH